MSRILIVEDEDWIMREFMDSKMDSVVVEDTEEKEDLENSNLTSV